MNRDSEDLVMAALYERQTLSRPGWLSELQMPPRAHRFVKRNWHPQSAVSKPQGGVRLSWKTKRESRSCNRPLIRKPNSFNSLLRQCKAFAVRKQKAVMMKV